MIESLYNIIDWCVSNYKEALIAVGGLLVSLQLIVRLFPTKDPNGFLARMDKWLNKAIAFVPNVKKEEGKLVPGVHADKPAEAQKK